MRKAFNLFSLYFLLFTINSQAQNKRDFQAVCFCITNHYSPEELIARGNNGQVVLLLEEPRRLEDLKLFGVTFSQQQIDDLVEGRLIKKINGTDLYKTTFPILNKNETYELRDFSKRYAHLILPHLRESIIDFQLALKKGGYSKHALSILYSYVLDHKVWKTLEDKGAIKRHTLNKDDTHWAGEFWIIEGMRNVVYEAMTLSNQNYSMMLSWSEGSSQNMKYVLSHWETVYDMLSDISVANRITKSQVNNIFGEYEMFDEKGKVLLPIIDETGNDLINKHINNLTSKISDQLLSLPLSEIKNGFSLRDNEESLIILYHELIWDIVDQIIAEKIIEVPKTFLPVSEVTPADFTDLIFLVKHKQNQLDTY